VEIVTVVIGDLVRKDKTAGLDRLAQKVKTVDLAQKVKTVDLARIADLDLRVQREKTVDLDQKVKTVHLDRRAPRLRQMVRRQHLNHSRRKRSLNQDLLEMVQRLPHLKPSIGIILVLSLLLTACGESGVALDETASFDEMGWIQKQPVSFNVSIPDSLSSYAVYVVVRQNNSYPFYNLYISPSILDAKGKTIQKGLAEAILYDPKTGKPKGAGFGDIYEKKFIVYPALKFPRKGNYKIQMEQSMRVDTLAGMVSIGLLLEKNERK
jgi:gliding motility-associated lipoprotein GldH